MPLYVVILFLCAGITIPLMLMAWDRRPARGSSALGLFLLCVGVASLSHAMNLTSAGLAQKIFWNHVEYLGGSFVCALMLVVAIYFTGREEWVRPVPMLMLLIIPTFTLIANWTNAWHHLYYTRLWLEPSGGYTILAKSRGPLYALNFGYAYLLTGSAIFLVIRSLRHPRGATRPQLFLLLAAFLLPLLFNIPYTFRWMPHKHINLTLLGFFFSSLIISYAMFKYKLLTEALRAANKRLEQMVASRETELRAAIADTLTAAEKEARRIGQDIHDGLCQDLVGLARLTEKLESEIPATQLPDQRQTAGQIREQTTRLAGTARTFSHDLTLHELEVQTLSEALDLLARRTEQIFHAETELNVGMELVYLSQEQTVHIYRIIREAVANAAKHAHARHIWIDLVQEPRELAISVSNDGRPIPDTALLNPGLGIRQMHMRARLLGASFTIKRNTQDKTVVELAIPHNGKESP